MRHDEIHDDIGYILIDNNVYLHGRIVFDDLHCSRCGYAVNLIKSEHCPECNSIIRIYVSTHSFARRHSVWIATMCLAGGFVFTTLSFLIARAYNKPQWYIGPPNRVFVLFVLFFLGIGVLGALVFKRMFMIRQVVAIQIMTLAAIFIVDAILLLYIFEE